MKQFKIELNKLSAQTMKVEAILREVLPETSKIINNKEQAFPPVAFELLGKCINELSLFEDVRNMSDTVSECIVRLEN